MRAEARVGWVGKFFWCTPEKNIIFSLDKKEKVTNIRMLLAHAEDETHALCTAYLDRISVSVILFGFLKYPLKISSK
ncbi:MAG: hypothetical protein DRH12_02920 [Deltaproteobacteria bacterium]|nr:MAG: hypothetical protein DRH12_02920 [Deltaproteobacteria bacterium]RLB85526.1 MAG: hypothetical protein DRH15_03280 [Deltaproteobacteria bacterium]